MATFKVGQRVRISPEAGPLSRRAGYDMHAGREGVITRLNITRGPIFGAYHELNIRHIDGLLIRVAASFLEPLTDPGADAFMERIKKLKPYDEPKVSVTTEHGTALFPK